MKGFRILAILTVLLLVFGIGFMTFFVYGRMKTSEYQFQVDAVLSAAAVANQGEPLTDPDKAVLAEYEGKTAVIVPGNYTALSSYLRKDAATLPFLRMDTSGALKITVCGEAIFTAVPADESGDVVLIRLETGGKVFRMRTDGGNQWASLIRCCMEGTYHDDNISMDDNLPLN